MIDWKEIKGHPGYSVSNEGEVIGMKGYKLKGTPSTSGYLGVFLCSPKPKVRREIHKLVAEAFIPNPTNKPCINHKDGNKINNHVDNLEWVTYSENQKHSWDNGLNKGPTKLSAETILEIIHSSLSNKEAALHYNISYGYTCYLRRNHIDYIRKRKE